MYNFQVEKKNSMAKCTSPCQRKITHSFSFDIQILCKISQRANGVQNQTKFQPFPGLRVSETDENVKQMPNIGNVERVALKLCNHEHLHAVRRQETSHHDRL